MACTPSPRNYQEMSENQAASLPRLGHIPDIACTSCPQKVCKCLKIRMHPYCGQDASLSWPWGSSDMACTLSPRNCQEMPENQAASKPMLGCVSNLAAHRAHKLPTNA
ncbi:Hypothetical predicted protein [Olea europaea subsp. europaea]|uniref:Uncharacterized protein n=1 Tax=Olea europaea subsp. europaea TaxID=158383 RepID=A0A8S0UVA4_OLEEU|nr:Hypothetical predicted protein [Olea europaea subsp. europaea]